MGTNIPKHFSYINEKCFRFTAELWVVSKLAKEPDEDALARGQRFRAVRQALGPTLPKIAGLLGISDRGWQNYEAGSKIPDGSILLRLAQNGVNVQWLLTGEGEMRSGESRGDLVSIPRYDIRAAAGGAGSVVSEDPSGIVALHREWLMRSGRLSPQNLVVLEASGDSMAPTIADGEPLIVDLADKKLSNGEIYVFRIGDAVQVKRIQRKMKDGTVTLLSDNAKYAAETLSQADAEALHVIGRVRWTIQSFGRQGT
jgi:phage repressor protein C with HTH and peptisase S24 domain